MVANTVEVEATLEADGRLILNERPALPPGRVRVVLQVIGSVGAADNDVIAVLQCIRTAQTARGRITRTKEEIDAALDAMRGEDEERMQGNRAS